MNVSKNSKDNRGLTGINLTSLVDVCLTLVIIFMVSYPLVMQSGIKVSTPSLSEAKSSVEETELKAEVYLKENDIVELNGEIIEQEFFADSLRSLLAASRNKMVVISAAGDVVHDRVIAVLDEAKQCGAKQLSLVRRN